ncbi:MAG: hypothetical protein IPP77_11280 [Bacteroidetes bacterium]|nr:hypothetical protein [Bacteroidota bacterium]
MLNILIVVLIALKLAKKTLLEKIALGRHIVTSLMGNSNYPSPNPTLADLTLAIDAAEQAANDLVAAKEAVITATDTLDLREKELSEMLTQEAFHVQEKSGGNKDMIISGGMPVKGDKTNSPLPTTVEGFTMNVDPAAGWAFGTWTGLPKSYNVQSYQMRVKVAGGEWVLVPEVTKKTKLRFEVPAPGASGARCVPTTPPVPVPLGATRLQSSSIPKWRFNFSYCGETKTLLIKSGAFFVWGGRIFSHFGISLFVSQI